MGLAESVILDIYQQRMGHQNCLLHRPCQAPVLPQPVCLTVCLVMKEQCPGVEVGSCLPQCPPSQFLGLSPYPLSQTGRQPIDAYSQPSPGPWEIAAKTPSFFRDEKQVIKVPYTSSVKNCHACVGMGRTPCTDCAGAGSKVCWVCNGSGQRHGEDTCHHCSGRGRVNCNFCHGKGSKECKSCHGRRQLLVFINLNVKWTNNTEDYVVEQSSGLHVANLSGVSGKELFRDTQYMVYPVMGFPDHGVVNAAERLVKDHQVRYSQTSRILQQRQIIELIPITKVTYNWKGNSHMYVVYGNELKVSADNYPATCCCTVM
ncbi:protein SSUH2 homolog isoform X4 [Osmerus mordax]|uniref:protein SSUH2 homolog isoform X4 n=1 Tax=Osmerus mordax TaxID=8014 RepID=UPI00350EDD30